MSRAVKTEWWLDASALPDRLMWGRLEVFADGTAAVLHYEFGAKRFPDEQEARYYLLEDEFAPLARLIEDGEVEPGLGPPAGADDAELLGRMLVRRHPAPGDCRTRPWWQFWA